MPRMGTPGEVSQFEKFGLDWIVRTRSGMWDRVLPTSSRLKNMERRQGGKPTKSISTTITLNSASTYIARAYPLGFGFKQGAIARWLCVMRLWTSCTDKGDLPDTVACESLN